MRKLRGWSEPYERFMALVEVPRNPKACWKWVGAKDYKGYGKFNPFGKGKMAHRYAYELFVGEIPEGLQACHKCDHRWCINPEHLFLGTAQDNSSDMVDKGRSCPGEKHVWAKLTDALVMHIRSSETQDRVFAKLYGVSRESVRDARRGLTWRHLPMAA